MAQTIHQSQINAANVPNNTHMPGPFVPTYQRNKQGSFNLKDDEQNILVPSSSDDSTKKTGDEGANSKSLNSTQKQVVLSTVSQSRLSNSEQQSIVTFVTDPKNSSFIMRLSNTIYSLSSFIFPVLGLSAALIVGMYVGKRQQLNAICAESKLLSATLLEENRQLQSRIQTFVEEKERLGLEYNQSVAAIQAIQEQIDSLPLNQAEFKGYTNVEKIKHFGQKMKQLQDSIAEKDQENTLRLGKIRQLKNAVASTTAILESKNRTIARQEGRIQFLLNEVKTLKQTNQTLTQQQTELNAEIDKLKQQNKELADKLRKNETELQEKIRELSQLRAQLQQMNDEKQKLQGKLETQEREHREAMERRDREKLVTQQEYAQQPAAQEREYAQQLEDRERRYNQQLEAQKQEHAKAIKLMRHEYPDAKQHDSRAQELEAERIQHQEQLDAEKTSQQEQLDAKTREHQEQLRAEKRTQEQLEAQLQQLIAQYEAYQKEQKKLIDEYSSNDARRNTVVAQQQQELEKLRPANLELQRSLSSSQEKAGALQKNYQLISQKMSETEAAIQQYLVTNTAQQFEIAQLQIQCSQLANELQSRDQSIQRYKTENDGLSTSKESLDQQIEQLTNQRSQLSMQVSELQSQLKSRESVIRKQQGLITEQERPQPPTDKRRAFNTPNMETLTQELMQLRGSYSMMQSQLAEANSQLESLTSELETTKSQNSSIQLEIKRLTSKFQSDTKQQQDKITSLEQSIGSKISENEALNSKNGDFQQQIVVLEKTTALSGGRIRQLSGEIEDFQAQKASLEQKITENEAKHSQLMLANEKLGQELAESTEKTKIAEARLESETTGKRRRQAADDEAEIAELRSQLEQQESLVKIGVSLHEQEKQSIAELLRNQLQTQFRYLNSIDSEFSGQITEIDGNIFNLSTHLTVFFEKSNGTIGRLLAKIKSSMDQNADLRKQLDQETASMASIHKSQEQMKTQVSEKQKFADDLSSRITIIERELEQLKEASARKIGQLEEKSAQNLRQLEEKSAQELRQLEEKSAQELKRLGEASAQELRQLEEKLAQEMNNQKIKFERQIQELQTLHSKVTEELKVEQESSLSRLSEIEAFKAKIFELTQESSAQSEEIRQLQKKLAAQIQQHSTEIEQQQSTSEEKLASITQQMTEENQQSIDKLRKQFGKEKQYLKKQFDEEKLVVEENARRSITGEFEASQKRKLQEMEASQQRKLEDMEASQKIKLQEMEAIQKRQLQEMEASQKRQLEVKSTENVFKDQTISELQQQIQLGQQNRQELLEKLKALQQVQKSNALLSVQNLKLSQDISESQRQCSLLQQSIVRIQQQSLETLGQNRNLQQQLSALLEKKGEFEKIRPELELANNMIQSNSTEIQGLQGQLQNQQQALQDDYKSFLSIQLDLQQQWLTNVTMLFEVYNLYHMYTTNEQKDMLFNRYFSKSVPDKYKTHYRDVVYSQGNLLDKFVERISLLTLIKTKIQMVKQNANENLWSLVATDVVSAVSAAAAAAQPQPQPQPQQPPNVGSSQDDVIRSKLTEIFSSYVQNSDINSLTILQNSIFELMNPQDINIVDGVDRTMLRNIWNFMLQKENFEHTVIYNGILQNMKRVTFRGKDLCERYERDFLQIKEINNNTIKKIMKKWIGINSQSELNQWIQERKGRRQNAYFTYTNDQTIQLKQLDTFVGQLINDDSPSSFLGFYLKQCLRNATNFKQWCFIHSRIFDFYIFLCNTDVVAWINVQQNQLKIMKMLFGDINIAPNDMMDETINIDMILNVISTIFIGEYMENEIFKFHDDDLYNHHASSLKGYYKMIFLNLLREDGVPAVAAADAADAADADAPDDPDGTQRQLILGAAEKTRQTYINNYISQYDAFYRTMFNIFSQSGTILNIALIATLYKMKKEPPSQDVPGLEIWIGMLKTVIHKFMKYLFILAYISNSRQLRSISQTTRQGVQQNATVRNFQRVSFEQPHREEQPQRGSDQFRSDESKEQSLRNLKQVRSEEQSDVWAKSKKFKPGPSPDQPGPVSVRDQLWQPDLLLGFSIPELLRNDNMEMLFEYLTKDISSTFQRNIDGSDILRNFAVMIDIYFTKIDGISVFWNFSITQISQYAFTMNMRAIQVKIGQIIENIRGIIRLPQDIRRVIFGNLVLTRDTRRQKKTQDTRRQKTSPFSM